MKTTILFILLICSINITFASGTLTIEHTTEGSLTGEITAQLPDGSELTDYTELIINGGTLNMNDCSAITNRLSHMVSIDFSNTSFKDNSIPLFGSDGPGTGTFSDLKSLQTVKFPDNLQVIGDYVFSKCVALKNIEFGENSQLETIGKHAFEETGNLTNPIFPENLSLIQEYAFYQCAGITRLTFPSGLSEIEDYAFQNCIGLANVDAPWETPITVGAYSFDGAGPVWNDQKEIILHVPSGTADLYRATNWNKLTILDDIGTGIATESLQASINYDYLTKLLTVNYNSPDFIRITNLKGQSVLNKQLNGIANFDLSYLEDGAYIITIGAESLKVLK